MFRDWNSYLEAQPDSIPSHTLIPLRRFPLLSVMPARSARVSLAKWPQGLRVNSDVNSEPRPEHWHLNLATARFSPVRGRRGKVAGDGSAHVFSIYHYCHGC